MNEQRLLFDFSSKIKRRITVKKNIFNFQKILFSVTIKILLLNDLEYKKKNSEFPNFRFTTIRDIFFNCWTTHIKSFKHS